jgi:xanthine dehydrogenase YagR molybdenum-binding subunit
MDVLARELGIDPLDLRMRNYADRDQQKRRPYTTKRLDACYREGAERFGWRGRSKPTTDGRVRRGFGMASQIWGGGGGPPAYALCRSNPDGTFDVLTGTQDLGTGSRTVFAQIAAEALGASLASVRVVLGDTERTPYTGNSWGSMTVPSVAPAVRMAAEDCRNQLLEAAAGLLDSQSSKLDVADGVVSIRGGGRSTTYADIGEALGDVMIVGRGSRGPNPDGKAVQAFGAQFAEVEVDEDTGIVRVVRIVAAHDAGRILNPTLAESQLEGGIIQGIGYALFEERVLDVTLGVPLNPTIHDYKVPTLADIPRIEAFFIAGSDPEANHTGAKGLAEPPIIPTAPAIANAVADALGVETDEIPLTPWRVLRALGR